MEMEMELNEDIFNQIHQYLNQEMDEDEKKKFENQMKTNSLFAQEVVTQRKIKSGLKINKYRQQFSGIHDKLKAENKLPIFKEKPAVKLNNTNHNLQYFAYAASIALVIGFGLFFYLNFYIKEEPVANIMVDKDKLTAQKSKPSIIESENVTKSTKSTKLIDYNKIFVKNFKDNPIIENPFISEKYGVNPSKFASWENDTLALRKGIHYLLIGKVPEAISEFKSLRDSKFETIRFHADWYLSMSYLKEKNIVKAKNQLMIIKNNKKHIYLEKSKRLIESL